MSSRALWDSPLAVVACGVLALGLFTCAAEQQGVTEAAAQSDTSGGESHPTPTSEDVTTEAEAAAPSVDSGPPPIPDTRPSPRLLRPPVRGLPAVDLALEDRDGQSMRAFHAALGRAARGEGQARLVFYGASHTAADFFTGYIRETLQTAYGDAGHGFILPVHPWRSYRHRGVRIESNREEWTPLRIRQPPQVLDHYGLAGVAVESAEVGAYGRVMTERRGEIGRSASHLELWYMRQPRGGRFRVFVDGMPRGTINTRAEQREAGYWTADVDDGPHRLELRVLGGGPVRIFGSVVERSEPGVIVDTLGINGSRARYHLLWEDGLYREHLARRNPDLVVLAYGTNESGDSQPIASYMDQLREVVGRVREVAPGASCLLVGPSDRPIPLDDDREHWEDRPRTHEIVEAQWRVALEHGCAFYDMVAWQGGPLSMVAWNELDPPFAAPDHIHLRRRGYERFGQSLLAALLEGFEPPEGTPRVDPLASDDDE